MDTRLPRLSGAALFFALAPLGLPGLGDFIGEFLILLGTFRAHAAMTAVAACGVLAATLYALRFVQRVFQGPDVRCMEVARPGRSRRTDAGRDDRSAALAGSLLNLSSIPLLKPQATFPFSGDEP